MQEAIVGFLMLKIYFKLKPHL